MCVIVTLSYSVLKVFIFVFCIGTKVGKAKVCRKASRLWKRQRIPWNPENPKELIDESTNSTGNLHEAKLGASNRSAWNPSI